MSNKIHVFTHHDLDGVCSLLLLTWIFPDKEITYTTCSNALNFVKEFTEWNKKHKIEDFDQIYILDLSINQKDIPLIDHKNVVFIDHHKTSVFLAFNKANFFIKKTTSCIMYIYKIFKNIIKISDAQKHLIILVDDYDCYLNNFKNSKKLNKVFRELYKDNIRLFLDHFSNGFTNFTETHYAAISAAEQKYINLLKNLKYFKASLTLQEQQCTLISTFADTAIDEIAEYILTTINTADIAVIVNIKNERVSFRRNKHCTVDVSSLAQKLCEGGGHEAAAGGALTESFMQFSKLFVPI
jgi:oligoribonuclease NrnB/cAMP/cGMP phosphodiesterase (DHH superfamily)